MLDFAHTTYVDSSGIGMLVSLARTIRAGDGELRLANVNADIQSLFELIKLDSIIDLRASDHAPS